MATTKKRKRNILYISHTQLCTSTLSIPVSSPVLVTAEDSGDATPSLGAITQNADQRQRGMISSTGAFTKSDSAWTRSQDKQ